MSLRHSQVGLALAMLAVGGMPERSPPARTERPPEDVAERQQRAKGKRERKAEKRAAVEARRRARETQGTD